MPSRIMSPFGTISLFSGEHDSMIEKVFGQAQEAGQKPEDTVLAVDIYEDDSQFVVRADLPGVAKDDVQVTLTEGILTINAESKPDAAPEQGQWLRRERRIGHFVRSIQMGGAIDADNISANLKDGVLELTVPKPKKVERQTISITTK